VNVLVAQLLLSFIRIGDPCRQDLDTLYRSMTGRPVLLKLPTSEVKPTPNRVAKFSNELDAAERKPIIESYAQDFLVYFPSLEILDREEEKRIQYMKALPNYIALRLKESFESGKSIEAIAQQYGEERALFEEARAKVYGAAKDFGKEKGWRTTETSDEYKALIQIYADKGIPVRPLFMEWRKGLMFLAQAEFFEWLQKNPNASWADIEKSNFLNQAGITPEILREWIGLQVATGTPKNPGPFMRAMLAVNKYAPEIYFPEEELAKGAEPEIQKGLKEWQDDLKANLQAEVTAAYAEIDRINQRFGMVVDKEALRLRVERKILEERAREILTNSYVLKKEAEEEIDWALLTKLKITELFSREEIIQMVSQSRAESTMAQMRGILKNLGVQLGEARIKELPSYSGTTREKLIAHYEKSQNEDVNIKWALERLRKLEKAYPGTLDVDEIIRENQSLFANTADVTEVITWVSEIAHTQTAAWIETNAKRLKYDLRIPMSQILLMAAKLEESKILEELFRIPEPPKNPLSPELNFLSLSNYAKPIDWEEARKTAEREWKAKKDHAEQSWTYAQQRFPTSGLKIENFRHQIQAEVDFRHGIGWISFNSGKPWKEIQAYLTEKGVFKRVTENSVKKMIVFNLSAPLINELHQNIYDWTYAPDTRKKGWGKTKYEIAKRAAEIKTRLKEIAQAYPQEFNMNMVYESMAEWSKDAQARFKQRLEKLEAEELKKIEQQGFWSKVWDVGMNVGESLSMITLGNIAQYGGYALSPFVTGAGDWGSDYIQWSRRYSQEYHNGSILGNDDEFSKASLLSSAFKIHTVVQAGKAFDPVLELANDTYDDYVKWVWDINTNAEYEALKKSDGLVRWGGRAFSTAEGAGALAVILATGGSAGMGARGSALLTRWGTRLPVLGRLGISAPRLAVLGGSPTASIIAGQTLTASQILAISGGMAFTTAAGTEMMEWDKAKGSKKPRDFDWELVLDNTYKSTNQSLLFSAGIGGIRRALATSTYRRTFANSRPPSVASMNQAQSAAWNQAMHHAGTQTVILDLVEGLSSFPEIVDLLEDGWRSGSAWQISGALLVTGANLWDMDDVREGFKGMKWSRPKMQNSQSTNQAPNVSGPDFRQPAPTLETIPQTPKPENVDPGFPTEDFE